MTGERKGVTLIMMATVKDKDGQPVSVVGEFIQVLPWIKVEPGKPDPLPYGLPSPVHTFQCYDTAHNIYAWSPFDFSEEEEGA